MASEPFSGSREARVRALTIGKEKSPQTPTGLPMAEGEKVMTLGFANDVMEGTCWIGVIALGLENEGRGFINSMYL